jgi:hypothetical protein
MATPESWRKTSVRFACRGVGEFMTDRRLPDKPDGSYGEEDILGLENAETEFTIAVDEDGDGLKTKLKAKIDHSTKSCI